MIMRSYTIVVGSVDFPLFLAIWSIFCNSFHITAIFLENGIYAIWSMAFFW